MNKLQTIVSIILEQQKLLLANSTYDIRKNYLKRLLDHAEEMVVSEPCQKLYDSFVAKATTTDMRFQYFHAVRLVDKAACTKAFTPNGKLYNEPEMPSHDEAEKALQDKKYPIADGSIDIGCLIRRAENEMKYLKLSDSTNWQYMQAWRELYISLYLHGNTIFNKGVCNTFIEAANQKHMDGIVHEWKRKIRRRAVCVLLEVADSGHFEWKIFRSRKVCCSENTLEKLRQQFIAFLCTQNFENKTIAIYDYSFRNMIEGLRIGSVSDLKSIKPKQIQDMIVFLSEKLSLNSRGTIFPIVRHILAYLHTTGFMSVDYSGMVLTPYYQKMHLRPYISEADEEKLYLTMEKSPLRNKAMMRLALRLGLRDTDICGLQFCQIDWKNDRIVLQQKKTGVTLNLPLLADVGNAIMDYIINERPKAAAEYPFVFVRKQAPYKKLSSIYMICSRIFDQANIQTINRSSRGVHICRHTLTHKLLLKKVPHQIITDVLGHVSKESDKPYLSMEEQMLRECPLDFSLIGQKHWKEGGHNG